MKKIIVATKNKGKVRDFEQLFRNMGYVVLSLLDIPNSPDIEETGKTFKENAVLKAEGISAVLNEIVIADDSGLAIDALEGRPGIFSARYAGPQRNDEDNMKKVLQELEGNKIDERGAAFHCALALAIPTKPTIVVEGTCKGYIATEPKGEHGFGYDPIFYLPTQKKTMAELTKEEKSLISHRANALQMLEKEIKLYLSLYNRPFPPL
jgi:XTP/dITP diphosphohydrolase